MSQSEPPCVELKIKPDCEVCGGIGLACCLKPIGPLRRCCNQLVYCTCTKVINHKEPT